MVLLKRNDRLDLDKLALETATYIPHTKSRYRIVETSRNFFLINFRWRTTFYRTRFFETMALLMNDGRLVEVEEESSDHSSTIDPSSTDQDRAEGSSSSSSNKLFERTVARKENRAVVQSKALVLLVIGLVATSFALAAFFLAKKAETSDFETK